MTRAKAPIAAAPGSPASSNGKVFAVLSERMDVERGVRLLYSGPMREMAKHQTASWRSISDTLGIASQKDGVLKVQYYMDADQHGFGRFKARVHATGTTAVPYVRMQREIRAWLAVASNWDIDMVNCHPVILTQMLREAGIESPLLDRYVTDRPACLEDLMLRAQVTKDQAKNLFIRLMFFGGIEGWLADTPTVDASSVPEWVHAMREELRTNAVALLSNDDYDDLRRHMKTRPDKTNALGSMMATLLQTKERQCVEALMAAIAKSGRRVGSIIYDGVHVEKEEDETEFPVVLLKTWSRSIFKATGFDVDLACKPFECNPIWRGEDATTGADVDYDDGWMKVPLSYEQMKLKFEERSAKIVSSASYIREGSDRLYKFSGLTLIEAFKHIKYLVVGAKADDEAEAGDDEKPVTEASFIRRWVEDKTIREYWVCGMFPPPLEAPSNTYNLWRGFAVASYKPTKPVDTDSEGVRAMTGHWDMLLHNKQESLEYVLDWQAQIFQQPAVKPGIAIILMSKQGSGKNRALDMLNYMMGRVKFMETGKPAHDLYAKWTSQRDGCFLAVINEASGSDNHTADNQIKDMITATNYVSETKGNDGVVVNCYARFVFTTNNDNCMKLSADDRRFVVIEASSARKGDQEYFKTLSAHMDDRHTQYEFYQFLMARDLSQRRWEKDRPITEFYMEMVQANLPFEHQFLRDKTLALHVDGQTSHQAQAAALHQEFAAWLGMRGYNGLNPNKVYNTSDTKFGLKLSKMHSEKVHIGGFEGLTRNRSGTTVYTLDVPSLLREMVAKRWMNADDVYPPLDGAGEAVATYGFQEE